MNRKMALLVWAIGVIPVAFSFEKRTVLFLKYIYYIIILTILFVSFASCKSADNVSNIPSSEAYSYIPSELPAAAETEPAVTEPYSEITTLPEETTTVVPVTTQPATTEPVVTMSPVSTTAAPETTSAPAAALPPETTTAESTTVDLTIELPEANGDMQVDTLPSNKFISAVKQSKNVDASLLAAVYSVPASGQNYVFEFYDAEGRSRDDLRRVYLLDDDCRITSVAAAKASEKVNVSSTENWFCFNVLIKGVIFDAIAEDL